jgi:predicted AAA+ superfamily ATPase
MIHKNIISRPIYTQQILPWIGRTGIVKVYIGQRRSGKSTIMQMIVAQLRTQGVPDSDIICINCEDMAYSNLSHTDLYQHIHTKKHIFIDEIQDIPEWEKTIRSMVAQDTYDIHITGSNSNLLSSELSTYLSGRYIAFQIYPLSYAEYIQFRGTSAGTASMTEYITYGGLPYIPDIIGSVSAVSQYLRSVYDTIVLHDIITRYSIRNIDFFNRLLIFLAQSIGDIFSAGSISRYLKSQKLNITVHGVLAYLEYARSACFLHKVSRYDIL